MSGRNRKTDKIGVTGVRRSLEVCPSGLWYNFAKVVGVMPRRFESCHFRVNTTNKQILEEELEVLRRAKDITLKSCLMAGILHIPDGIQCWNSDVEDEPEDKLIEELSEALLDQAVGDIDTISTYAPIILRGPVELLKEIRLLKFGDAHLLEVLQDRIEVIESRLALIKEPVVQ